MARNNSGVYSLPGAGLNPVVSRTSITSLWANTTLSDIGSEITNSLDRGGRGAMVGALQLPDGTAALPSMTFSGDPNTGVYRVGADSLGFSAGGAVRARLDTGQLLTIDGAIATPAWSFLGDTNVGLYRAGSDDLRVAINSKDIASFTTKLSISAATAATGGTRQDALSLTNGDLDLSAATAPTSTTAIANRLTKANLVKAWVTLSVTGGNGGNFTVTVAAGFNIASVARASATRFTVTFASAFSDNNYGIWGQFYNTATTTTYCLDDITSNVGSAVIGLAGSGAGSVDLDASATINNRVTIVFLGAQ